MSSVGRGERDLVHAIRDELGCLRIGEPALPRVVGLVHELLGGELVWTHRPARTLTGWKLEDKAYHQVCTKLSTRFEQCVATIPGEFAWFRPSSPEPKQRNRVVDSLAAVRRERPGFFESTQLYQECLEPLGFHEHHQLRVVICDGAELLAWFGIFQRETPTRRQFQRLAAIVPALHRRLRLERSLGYSHVARGALAAALDAIEHPAFVIGARDRIELANRAGLSWFAEDPARARESLRTGESFAVPGGRLVIVRAALSMCARARAAARRWALTPRQAAVLDHVVAGHANATIAELMAISPRAVEYHLTAIFARTNTQNRAALVAAVASEATG